jgi:ribosomal protein L16 Arg81 hydroxylase
VSVIQQAIGDVRDERITSAGSAECVPICGGAGILSSPWLFESILSPVSAPQFCREYWGRKPLRVARGDADYFRGLFSLAELEQYLSQSLLFEHELISTPRREYGRPDEPPASVSEVYERVASGRSLRLRGMERFLNPGSPLLSLVRNIQEQLRHPLESLSCYVTPRHAEGLGPHQDATEIFTLQISGSKHWRIFGRADSYGDGLHSPDSVGPATDDFVLEPGDVFYLPRGYVHDVTAANDSSFSLTIVFSPLEWRSLIELLASKLATTNLFRESVPAGSLSDDGTSNCFRDAFEMRRRLIREVLDSLTPAQLIDEMAIRHMEAMPMPPQGHIHDLSGLDKLSLDTWLEKRPGVACHLKRTPGRVALVLPGGYKVEANERAEAALQFVLASNRPFRAAQMDKTLGEKARLSLARHLVTSGLLRMANGEPRSGMQ